MTLDESVQGMRLRVIARAQVLGNVSAVCREVGISRTLFYRWRKRVEQYGPDGVHPRRQRAQPGRPASTPPEVPDDSATIHTKALSTRRMSPADRPSDPASNSWILS